MALQQGCQPSRFGRSPLRRAETYRPQWRRLASKTRGAPLADSFLACRRSFPARLQELRVRPLIYVRSLRLPGLHSVEDMDVPRRPKGRGTGGPVVGRGSERSGTSAKVTSRSAESARVRSSWRRGKAPAVRDVGSVRPGCHRRDAAGPARVWAVALALRTVVREAAWSGSRRTGF
jgi:hypothetical protein